MSRARQEQLRRERDGLCSDRFPGDLGVFEGARCKRAQGHEPPHGTWRVIRGEPRAVTWGAATT